MLTFEYPIVDSLRLPVLTLEVIFMLTSFEIGVIFFLMYFKKQKRLRDNQILGFTSLMFGFSLFSLFRMIADFFVSSATIEPFLIWNRGNPRDVFEFLAYFTIMVSGIDFFLNIERDVVFLWKKYFCSISYGFFTIFFIIVFILDLSLIGLIATLSYAIFTIYLIFYLKDFIRKTKKGENIYSSLKYLLGYVILIGGFFLTFDLVVSSIGLLSRLLGTVLEMIGILIISYFFIKLPEFAEFDWYKSIENIFLLSNSGIVVFNRSEEEVDENLIGGALSIMKSVVEILTKEKGGGFSVLEKEEKKIITFQGEHLTGVIFCSKELKTLKALLRQFVLRVEELYPNLLSHWDGHQSLFDPVKYICDAIFKE